MWSVVEIVQSYRESLCWQCGEMRDWTRELMANIAELDTLSVTECGDCSGVVQKIEESKKRNK